MKTKRSRKQRTCDKCGTAIAKGDQYAQRSRRLGDSGLVGYDGTVKHWEPYYVRFPICGPCAEEG